MKRFWFILKPFRVLILPGLDRSFWFRLKPGRGGPAWRLRGPSGIFHHSAFFFICSGAHIDIWYVIAFVLQLLGVSFSGLDGLYVCDSLFCLFVGRCLGTRQFIICQFVGSLIVFVDNVDFFGVLIFVCD